MPVVNGSKPTNVAETLRAARAKIAEPKHWTKGAFARPSKRSVEEVKAAGPTANAWCALGTLAAVDGPFEQSAIRALAEVIGSGVIEGTYIAAPNMTVFRFNDHPQTRHRDILRIFDKAIAAAEAVQS